MKKGGCVNGCIVPKLYIELAKREDEERIRADIINDILEEIDALSHQGGGLDDLWRYLMQIKEQNDERL